MRVVACVGMFAVVQDFSHAVSTGLPSGGTGTSSTEVTMLTVDNMIIQVLALHRTLHEK